MAGYLFVHFTKEHLGGEQVYFSISRDGLHFKDLNSEKPVLVSNIGQRGVRDPFIVRHPKTGKYYIIATDLSVDKIHHDWGRAVSAGSRDMIIWESDDLINWSEERAVTLAPEGAGCLWAPEAIYNEEDEAYLVFFACMTDINGERKHRIFAVHTNDFITFTEPELYIEHKMSIIDTTIIREHGKYFRFSKDEETKHIEMDCGDTLTGEFTSIHSEVLSHFPGLEGPECYQLPNGKWCLICDRYATSRGYVPIIIDDLGAGEMRVLEDGEYDFDKLLKRHGGVLKIDDEAYARLEEYYK